MSAWTDYLAAAQRLDTVRRDAAIAAGKHAEAVLAARQELTGVRARLVPQQTRLRAMGVPERELVPAPAEVAHAGRAMAAGPEAVLTALRAARSSADAADATVGGIWVPAPSDRHPWLRALLLYGPFVLALFVLLVCVGAGVFAVRG